MFVKIDKNLSVSGVFRYSKVNVFFLISDFNLDPLVLEAATLSTVAKRFGRNFS